MKRTKLRYATYERTCQDGTLRISHHDTDIIIIDMSTNEMILKNGGYFSKTTKDRLNQFNTQGLKIFSHKGTWMVQDKTDTYPYQNGMIFKDGQLWLEPGCTKKKHNPIAEMQRVS